MELPSASAVCQEFCKRLQRQAYKDNALSIFNSVSSGEDQVEICLFFMENFGVTPTGDIVPPSVWLKSSSEALTLRKAGNAEFAAKEYAKAILFFTKSIAAAPTTATEEDPETRCLSLAFANRSAALYHLQKYKECIQDIDNALHVGYPWDLRSKLYVRRGKCGELLGSPVAAKEDFQMALQYVRFSSDKELEKKIQNYLKEVEAGIAIHLEGATFTEKTEEQSMPLLKNGTSMKILSASKCVDINYLPSMGRHLIATEHIDPGDVLIVDKAYTSVLFQDYCHTHCYNCLKRSLILIPCINCTKVMFCSTDCRNKGWSNYHEIECLILPFLHQMQVGRNGLLAMKTVLTLFLSQDFCEVREKIFNEAKLEESLRGLDDEGAYNASNYNAVYWLVTNTERKAKEELFENAVLASYMVQVLAAYTSFFDREEVRKLVVDKGIENIGNIFGGLLLRHLHNFPCNAHSVVEMMKLEKNSNEEVVEIGAAVYATLSLINHSCDPNVARFSHNGNVAVLRAIKHLLPGQQLFDNYGYHFSLMDKKQRQDGLECYYQFRCNCQACCDDWPEYQQQPSGIPTFICQRCNADLNTPGGECPKCEAKHNLTAMERHVQNSDEKVEKIITKLQNGTNISEGEVMLLIDHLKLLGLNVRLPFQQYYGCQEALKHFFAKMGNYFSVD